MPRACAHRKFIFNDFMSFRDTIHLLHSWKYISKKGLICCFDKMSSKASLTCNGTFLSVRILSLSERLLNSSFDCPEHFCRPRADSLYCDTYSSYVFHKSAFRDANGDQFAAQAPISEKDFGRYIGICICVIP